MTTTSYNIYQQITSVRVATTVNLSGNYFNGALNNGVGATLTALSVGTLSIDGVLLEAGDRILVKNQTNSVQNGLYVVQFPGGLSSLWIIERAPDFQSIEQLKVGQYFTVGAGSTYEGSMYVLIEPLPETIGMSSFNFVNVADSGIAPGPYLLKANNFTDVSNPEQAFQNLGTGTGLSITITDGDFSGGIYQISSPFPLQIVCNNLAVGGQEIRLPVANIPFESPALGQGPILKMIDCVPVNIALSDGTIIDNLEGYEESRYACNDKSTAAGAYTILGNVYSINGESGRVDFTSNDGSVTITPNLGNSTIDLSVPDVTGNVIKQQLWVNNANGLDSNVGGIDSPFKTYSAAVAYAKLTASPTNRFLINIIGDQSSTSPVIIPYADLVFHSGTWTVTGGLGLDASWDTVVNNEIVTIQGMKLSGFWTFNWIGNTGNVIKFLNCDHSLTVTGNCISNSPAFNSFMVLNDTAENPTSYSSGLFITQSGSYLRGLRSSGTLWYNIVQNGYAINHYLYDSDITFGIVLKKDVPNTSTQNVYVKNTPMPVNSPVLEDPDSIVYIDTDSYINTPTFFAGGAYSQIVTRGVNATPIYIYVNPISGNDSNSGSPQSPLATYEAARLLAISRGASSNQPYVIKMVGVETITGNMTLSANVSVECSNPYTEGFIVNGDVVIDPNWGLSDLAYTQVRNMYMYLGAGNYTFTFTHSQVFSFLKFVNVAMNTGGFISITGSGDVGGNRETIVFENCTNDLLNYADGFIAENVDLDLINTDITAGSVTMTASTAAAVNYHLVINNARFYTNDITVITTSTSTLTTYITASNTQGRTLTINGANNTVNVDATSYMFALVLAGGATLSNLVTPTKTDGMVNSSYTPSNYTPTGDTLYAASTLTGNLKGIDSALGVKANVIPYIETSNLTNVMSPNTEYTANNAAVVSLTLPTNSSVGDTIRVNGKGAGGWRIDQQNAGHVIHVGAASTTVGPAGSLASATQFASVTLRCITANDVWEAISFAGTFTPV